MSEHHMLFNEQPSIFSPILDILVIMAHDTRSPLISMAIILKFLSRGDYRGITDENVKNNLDDCYIRIIRLMEIIAELKCSNTRS